MNMKGKSNTKGISIERHARKERKEKSVYMTGKEKSKNHD
jgi:hypothetical protein